jgi:uncharacterized protein (TIGR00251 family)
MAGWLTADADGVRVALKVSPRASREGVLGVEVDAGGQFRLTVAVSAPPEGGRANATMIKVLARRWRLPQSTIEIISGARARHKLVHVRGLPAALLAKLEVLEGGAVAEP